MFYLDKHFTRKCDWNIMLYKNRPLEFIFRPVHLASLKNLLSDIDRNKYYSVYPICGCKFNTAFTFTLKAGFLVKSTEITYFSKCSIENYISCVQFNSKYQIYILDVYGDVYVWDYKAEAKPIKIDGIPKITAIHGTREYFYFIANDSSLWAENNSGHINQMINFRGVLNIFSTTDHIFILCENGRILWKGNSLIEYNLKKTNEFVEICPYSNVKSIAVHDSRTIFFIFDDGYVYALCNFPEIVQDIDFVVFSSYVIWYLNFSGELITGPYNYKKFSEISVLDATPLASSVVVLLSDSIGEFHSSGKYEKFSESAQITFTTNKQKSARK